MLVKGAQVYFLIIAPSDWYLPDAKYCVTNSERNRSNHDDVIKWKHFPRYCPFVRGIHRWPVNSLHEGQWCRALIFSLICLNKRLSKQSWGWWFEMPSRPLWRHCNVSCWIYPLKWLHWCHLVKPVQAANNLKGLWNLTKPFATLHTHGKYPYLSLTCESWSVDYWRKIIMFNCETFQLLHLAKGVLVSIVILNAWL